MKESHAEGPMAEEEWVTEMLNLGKEEKLTPKQTAILHAGIEVFSEKGFSAAATSEIAQKAGVAEGTIFRYYKTKKDLLISIVAPTMSRMLAPFVMRKFDGILDIPFESYEDFLRAFIKNRLEFGRKNLKIIRILIQEIPFHEGLREQFVENILSQVLERVKVTIEHFKQQGQIVEAPTPAVIRFTVSAAVGFLLARLVLMPDADWDDEQEIDQLIRFIMHGIGAQ